MRIKLALIVTLSLVLLASLTLFTRNTQTSPRQLPARQTSQRLIFADSDADAGADRDSAVNGVAGSGNKDQFEVLFADPKLPATAKADLIDAALIQQDPKLIREAHELVRQMVETGNAAEVLAAIPKVVYFADENLDNVASLQKSLCRFQFSEEDQLGFEMIKLKFAMVMGNEPSVRPWTAVCGAT